MLHNYVNFDFSIMKKLLDEAHGKLIGIIGRHGILDQYLWMPVMPQDDHLCSKSAQKRQLLLGTVVRTLQIQNVDVTRIHFHHFKILFFLNTYLLLTLKLKTKPRSIFLSIYSQLFPKALPRVVSSTSKAAGFIAMQQARRNGLKFGWDISRQWGSSAQPGQLPKDDWDESQPSPYVLPGLTALQRSSGCGAQQKSCPRIQLMHPCHTVILPD